MLYQKKIKKLIIEEKKEKSKRSIASVLLDLVLVAAIIVSLLAGKNLYLIYNEYKAGSDEYAKIQEMVVNEKKAGEEEVYEIKENGKKSWKAPIDIDFSQLIKINPDVVGWIYIEAIPSINYPITQGEDNDYYLHKTYEKQDNFAGSIFMDCDNKKDFSDCNTIVYGHNMRNGTMFGSLKKFQDPSTIINSDAIWILTPQGDYKYQIFSAYNAVINSETYTLFKGPGEQFLNYANSMKSRTELSTEDYSFETKDKILTLSTCTGNSNTRYVIQAVRVDPESIIHD